MKHLLFLLLAFVIGLSILGFSLKRVEDSRQLDKGDEKITIATSFYPLYFLTSEIGKDKIEIINLTPTGAEPHDFELKTQDLLKISNSQLLIINGLGFEPWADKLTDEIIASHQIVRIADGIANQTVSKKDENIIDPHIWLDPILAQQMVKKITQQLIFIDPENQQFYQSNSSDLLAKLWQLDLLFADKLSRCQQHQIITSHDAFGYLASRYHFEQIAVNGLSPDQEPSARKLAQVTDLAKQINIKYIFFETLISPRIAETIAQELGAKTLYPTPPVSTMNQLSHFIKILPRRFAIME